MRAWTSLPVVEDAFMVNIHGLTSWVRVPGYDITVNISIVMIRHCQDLGVRLKSKHHIGDIYIQVHQ